MPGGTMLWEGERALVWHGCVQEWAPRVAGGGEGRPMCRATVKGTGQPCRHPAVNGTCFCGHHREVGVGYLHGAVHRRGKAGVVGKVLSGG